MLSERSRLNTRSSGTGRTHGHIITGTGRGSCRGGERRGFWVFADRRVEWSDLEGIFSLRRFVAGRFSVVRERSARSLEKVGRFRVEKDTVVIYLDGIGSFQVGRAQIIPVLLRLGDEVIRDWD